MRVNRVQQYVRDGHLLAVRDAAGVRHVPALFIQDGAVVKALPSVITQLRDARFERRRDRRLAATARTTRCPARRSRRCATTAAREVKRRAQVAGY